jgi:hypothetical protein
MDKDRVETYNLDGHEVRRGNSNNAESPKGKVHDAQHSKGIADPLFAPLLAAFCAIVGVLFAISVRYHLDPTGEDGRSPCSSFLTRDWARGGSAVADNVPWRCNSGAITSASC